jgi:hypothetical protein
MYSIILFIISEVAPGVCLLLWLLYRHHKNRFLRSSTAGEGTGIGTLLSHAVCVVLAVLACWLTLYLVPSYREHLGKAGFGIGAFFSGTIAMFFVPNRRWQSGLYIILLPVMMHVAIVCSLLAGAYMLHHGLQENSSLPEAPVERLNNCR